jgi:hypothetical protein
MPGARLLACACAAALLACGAPALGAAAADAAPQAVRDPHYGAVLFDFYLERYFPALTGLMASQQLGRVSHHEDDAEILRGGLFLSYGLHQEAARIFERLIERKAPPAVRDRAWFYLAKIRYQRGMAAAAEEALDRVAAPLPGDLEDERILLKGNLLMARGEFAAAAALLRAPGAAPESSPYVRYNLGVALVRNGAGEEGRKLLADIGSAPAETDELRALRDKANLALGFAALQEKRPYLAQAALERVRLQGPMSDVALLGYGWAQDALHMYAKALVPWEELAGRDTGSSAVLEARLAVPYALVKIGSEGLAARRYEEAIAAFEAERASIDDEIAAMRSGGFLDELVARNPGAEARWFAGVERLPAMHHGAHLIGLLASNEFQAGFKGYEDLLFLARNLHEWMGRLDTSGGMLEERRRAFAERLPGLGMQEKEATLRGQQAREASLTGELEQTEKAGDGVALADARERALQLRLERALQALDRLQADAGAAGGAQTPAGDERQLEQARVRLQRAEGALAWNLGQELPERLWDAKKGLHRAATELGEAQQRQQELARAGQTEPQRFEGFAGRIEGLRARVVALLPRIESLAAEQRVAVQELAVAQLEQQKRGLADYADQARFALAQIYDRAVVRSERSTAAEQPAQGDDARP